MGDRLGGLTQVLSPSTPSRWGGGLQLGVLGDDGVRDQDGGDAHSGGERGPRGNDGGIGGTDAGGGVGCQWLKSELFGAALEAFKAKWGIWRNSCYHSPSSHDTFVGKAELDSGRALMRVWDNRRLRAGTRREGTWLALASFCHCLSSPAPSQLRL